MNTGYLILDADRISRLQREYVLDRSGDAALRGNVMRETWWFLIS